MKKAWIAKKASLRKAALEMKLAPLHIPQLAILLNLFQRKIAKMEAAKLISRLLSLAKLRLTSSSRFHNNNNNPKNQFNNNHSPL